MEKTVNELIDSSYKEYSQYTIKSRALPSNVDGLKPVQRKILYYMLQNKGLKKVAEIGGSLSSINYHHGEAAAQTATVKMAQGWANNLPLLKGSGGFGSVIVQEAAAPRYIFAELSPIVPYLFKDTDLCPAAEDPEDPEPEYFLPLIPFALLNGISGIAVGFATNIMPHDPYELIKQCRAALRENAKLGTPEVKWPSFTGEHVHDGEGKYTFYGKVEEVRGGFLVTEVPAGQDRLRYVSNLEKLVERGVINDYEDYCSKKGFNFKIKTTKKQKTDIEKKGATESLKLVTNQTENIVMVDHLQDERAFVYIPDSISEYIKSFVDFRLQFYQKRIDKELDQLIHRKKLLEEKSRLIDIILTDLNVINKLSQTRKESMQFLRNNNFSEENLDSLLAMPLYSFNKEKMKELFDDIKKLEREIEKMKKTKPANLYDKELGELEDKMLKEGI